MGAASYLQTSFLGGKWSTASQGRADEEAYRTALNVSFNALPVEAGSHTRRPGTFAPSTTYHGLPGILRTFHFTQSQPFQLEFTDNRIRLWSGTSLLFINEITVSSISGATVTSPAHGYSTGDQIQFTVTNLGAGSIPGISPLLNVQWDVTVVDANSFTVFDPIAAAALSGVDMTGWQVDAAKVVIFTTPYVFGTGWTNVSVRVVQDQDVAFILVPGFAPLVIQNTQPGSTTPTFSLTTAAFLDGPYMDPPIDGSTLTPDRTNPNPVTLTASAIGSINNGAGFQVTDVGRQIRLLSEPLNWAVGTSYTAGQSVRYLTNTGPTYYRAIQNNIGADPTLDDGINWIISTTAASWTWGYIASVADAHHCTVNLQAGNLDQFLQPLAGGALLYTNPISVWRLGVWSTTTGYPESGCYHEGRFWLGSQVGNRFDGTMSNDNFRFSPTLIDGTVPDNCGVSEALKGDDINKPLWFAPISEGIGIGTQGGEWLVQASSANEPITPTSVQAHKVTKIGCANVEPRYAGSAWVFVQRYQRQVYEYLADAYSRKIAGKLLSTKARDLTAGLVVEIVYQFENVPCIWARTATGRLIGCTYKRDVSFTTSPPTFMGWHDHALGSGRTVESLQEGPSPDGTLDSISMVTHDAVNGLRYVEFLTPMFEETQSIQTAYFVDSGPPNGLADIETVNGKESIVYYGLRYLNGRTLSAFIGGVDAGDFVVTNNTITVPIDGSANSLLTQAYLEGLSGGSFGFLGIDIMFAEAGQGNFSPFSTALAYTSSTSAAFHAAPINRCAFDWDNDLLYHIQGLQGFETQSLFKFKISTQAQIGSPINAGTFLTATYSCIGYDHNIYYIIGLSSIVSRYNVSTNTTDATTSSIDQIRRIVTIKVGSKDYALVTGLNSGAVGSSWQIINLTDVGGPNSVANGVVDEHSAGSGGPANAFPCFGPPGSAYIVSIDSPLGVGVVIGIYKMTANNPSSGGAVKIGTITPSQVVGSWTTFNINADNMLYDETDGHLILSLIGSDSTCRLIKVNSNTAAVMWTTLVASNVGFNKSRVRFGSLSYLDQTAGPVNIIRNVNTLTGASTVSTPAAIGPNYFSSSDLTGQIVVNVNDIGNIEWETFGPASPPLPPPLPAVVINVPTALGFNYVSQGQLLRPIAPAEAGVQTPALGKTRRQHMYAALLTQTQGIQVGTDFTKMRAAKLVSAGRTQPLAANVLFSDVIQDTLEDTASFHSMWAWQTTRPYPTTVVSVEGNIHTSDR